MTVAVGRSERLPGAAELVKFSLEDEMADLTQTTANVATHALNKNQLDLGVAGEALSEGMPVYKGTDQKWYKAIASDTDVKSGLYDIMITVSPSATDGKVILQKQGDVDLGATLAVGETYVVSATSGKICPIGDLVSTNYVTYLGIASTTSKLTMDLKATGTQVA